MWPPRPAARGRRAFALLAVLWVVVGVSTLVLGAGLIAREAVATAANRTAATRAFWRAEECLARARAAIAESLVPREGAGTGHVPWASLDTIVARSPLLGAARCRVKLEAVGTRLDLNRASRETLRRALAVVDPAAGDSLADALLDWRDADGVPRPYGAESPWYAARGRRLPRNGPLADVRELAGVRGFDRIDRSIDSIFGVEPGPIVLARAPLAVLAALPGISQEALARIGELRASGRAWGLENLAGVLSIAGRDSLMARYQELARLTTETPGTWRLESSAGDGEAAPRATIRVRLVRSGRRAAIVRRQVTR